MGHTPEGKRVLSETAKIQVLIYIYIYLTEIFLKNSN